MDETNHIQLNGYRIQGHKVIEPEVLHTIILDGKEVKLNKDVYDKVKTLLG